MAYNFFYALYYNDALYELQEILNLEANQNLANGENRQMEENNLELNELMGDIDYLFYKIHSKLQNQKAKETKLKQAITKYQKLFTFYQQQQQQLNLNLENNNNNNQLQQEHKNKILEIQIKLIKAYIKNNSFIEIIKIYETDKKNNLNLDLSTHNQNGASEINICVLLYKYFKFVGMAYENLFESSQIQEQEYKRTQIIQKKNTEMFFNLVFKIEKEKLGEFYINKTLKSTLIKQNFLSFTSEYQQLCYQTRKTVFGENHHQTLLCLKFIYQFNLQNNQQKEISEIKSILKIEKSIIDHQINNVYINDEIFDFDIQQICQTYKMISNYYLDLGNHEIAIKKLEKCIKFQNKLTGSNKHLEHAKTLTDIGQIYFLSSNYQKAYSLFQKSLDYINLGTNSSNNANLSDKQDENKTILTIEASNNYNSLGLIDQILGKYDQCFENFQKCFEIRKKLLGEAHYEVLVCQNNIGDALIQTGRVIEAQEQLQSALKEIKNDNFNKNGGFQAEILKATLLNNLGIIYDRKGKFQESLQLFSQSLEIRKSQFQTEMHEEVGQSYNNLGSFYMKQSDYDKALDHLDKALKIFQNTLGKDHKEVASVFNNIGNIYQQQGQFDLALEYLLQSFEMRKKIYGEEHAEIAQSLNNLGMLYLQDQSSDKGLFYLNESLNMRKHIFGEYSDEVAQCINNIGQVYYKEQFFDEALECYNKALNIFENVQGDYLVESSTILNNIGSIYFSYQMYQVSLMKHQECLEIRLKIYSEKHELSAQSYNNLGTIYYHLNDSEKSLTNIKKAIHILDQIYSGCHKDIADYLINCGQIYLSEAQEQQEDGGGGGGDNQNNQSKKNSVDMALEQFHKALEVYKKYYKDSTNHIDIGQAHKLIGQTFKQHNNPLQAIINLKEALRIIKKQFGPIHEDVLEIKKDLEELNRLQLEDQKYLEYQQQLQLPVSLENSLQSQIQQDKE